MVSFLQNKRRIAMIASFVFVLMLVYTWQALNVDYLPVPSVLRGGSSSSSGGLVVQRYHEVTCPAPAGGSNPGRIPVIRGRNVSSSRYAAASSSSSHANGGDNRVDGQATLSVPKVVALVFFGRRTTVSILDCYLKRNLVSNGGILDEVMWLQRTDKQKDLDFLDKMVADEERYTKRVVNRTENDGFSTAYDDLDDETLYIKIDDDVVYIEDNAILSIVCTKLMHPEHYIVSANVINQPMMSWVHLNLGAVLPYMPDTKNGYPEYPPGEHTDWRASALPEWEGNANLKVLEWESPDKEKHRWLPMHSRKDHILDKTAIKETEYDAFGKGLGHWQIAAQQHMSFFEHLENEELWRYMFNTWDFQRKRMGIQFIALMGIDINRAKPISGDDEQHFSVTMPEKFGRTAVADGRAIISHYSFGPQSGQLPTTDILERYRAYADEFVCKGRMHWAPEGWYNGTTSS